MSELRFVLGALLLAAAVTSCTNDPPAAPAPSAGGEGAEEGEGADDAGRPPPPVAHVGTAARGGIPVLVFHQLCGVACAATDTYGITKSEFARMLGSIKRTGYQTLSMADFVRAHAGLTVGLPQRPILITFDDGRIDGYQNADPVLRDLGFEATMFIITASATGNSKFAMQWPQIREAAASGRWTIQLHAHAGHVQVPIAMDPAGVTTTGAFYGFLQCAPRAPGCRSLESFDDWKERSERDLAMGDALLASELGPALYTPQSFAVPYGDYGQNHSNDARIAGELRRVLDAHFAVWFTQPSSDPNFMRPSVSDSHEVARFRIVDRTTAEDVDAWLARHAEP